MENKELKEKQKKEAIERLKILQREYKVHPNVLTEFRANETIYYSETISKFFSGVLYWLENKQQFVDEVRKIEEKQNIFVYHCILNHTEFGDLLTMLYVSSDEEYWQYERKQLIDDGIINAYVCNLDDKYFSEFGGVKINGKNGGLVREI